MCLVGVSLLAILAFNRLNLPQLTTGPVSLKNHIAFVGNDGNIWLMDGNGDNLQSITADGRYRLPTWSPDGRYLAFIGPDDNRRPALFISETKHPNPRPIYSQPVSAPFYLYWATDSRSLTFLTQEAGGLAMRTITPATTETTTLGEGSPFYWVWSPAGDRLFMHVGGSAPEARLSFLDNRPDADRMDLDLQPGVFQAPAWSADGQSLFYVTRPDSGGQAITQINADTLAQQTLVNLPNSAPIYLAASADNTHLAYLQTFETDGLPHGQVHLIDTTTGHDALVSQRAAISFFWSPDGSKLALLTANQGDNDEFVKGGGLAAPNFQQMTLQWWVYSVETGELTHLLNVNPTLDFMQIIPFFDQYHHSLSLWSPDSRYLLVVNAQDTVRQGDILLVDTGGLEAAKTIAEGTLAVWSWQ